MFSTSLSPSLARALLLAAAVITGTLTPSRAAAQAQPGTLSGVVRNEAGRALENALVVLNPETSARRADTDTEGRFKFDRIGAGTYELRVLLVGYEPAERTLQVGAEGLELTIVLRRVAFALDTLRVVARETGVLGVVVTRESFAPVNKATVRVMATRSSATTGPDGKFTILGLKPGGYVVFAKAPDRLPATIPVVVPADSAVELLFSMPSISAPGSKRLVTPLANFETRVQYALRSRSALVPRQELLGKATTVGSALRYAATFARIGLRLTDGACIYVNGEPRPLMTANDIRVADVDRVEVYGQRAFGTQFTGLSPWPAYAPCGNPDGTAYQDGIGTSRTGLQLKGQRSARLPPDSDVRIIVIWLKQ